MKKFTSLIILFLILVGATSSYAATRFLTGAIDKVQFVAKNQVNYTINTEGMAFIPMSELLNPCTCYFLAIKGLSF